MPSVERVCGCGASFAVDTKQLSPRFAEILLSAARTCAGCASSQRAAQDAEDADRLARSEEATYQRHLHSSGVPADIGIGLERDAGRARDAAREWAADGGTPMLVLTGPIGTGKTTLAAAAFRHRLRRRPGYWRTVPILLAHLSAGFGTQQHDEAVQLLDGRRMLALDDIDKARPSEYAAERIFAAVDSCYAHRTPLVVTTNLGMADLALRWPEPFGDAIASRLTDRAVSTVVRIEGDDRRRTNKSTPKGTA